MIASLGLSFLIFLFPLVAAGVWKIVSIQRTAAKAERDALPFIPAPQPGPASLGGLPPARRVFLMQHLKVAGYLYAMMAWTIALILTLPLFTLGSGNSTKWFNHSAYFWYSFITGATHSTQFLSIMVLFSAIAVIMPMRFGPEARFYRTRPIPISFVFWTKVLSVLTAMIAGAATGIALAFAILVALEGPIWHNLPVIIPRILGPDDADVAQLYASLLVTSAPSIFLSIITTIALFFSAVLFLGTAPVLRVRSNAALPLLMVPAAFVPFAIDIISNHSNGGTPHFFRTLYIYLSLGPPPPLAYALIPIALAAICITCARLFTNHQEI